ncbi:MAG TPA: hypothetical protein VFV98_19105 [Vicinamibacterales bacterium]|nr:hypothetical protein [Vicinamibacterales bacterium]
MGILRAFIWLRWRLMRNSLRSGQRRDALEQFSRGLAFLMPAIIVVLSAGSILGSGLAGFMAGLQGGRGRESHDVTVLAMRILLFGAFVFQVIFAVVSPTQSAFAKYTRLLLLPIRQRLLHLIEVLSTLADPWMFIVVPGLMMFALGLAIGGRLEVAAIALAAAILLLGVLASFGSLVAFLIGWLLRNRRRAEMFTLVFVLSLSLASIIPAAMSKRYGKRHQPRDPATTSAPQSLEELNASLPAATLLLPSEIYGRTIANAFDGHYARAGMFLLGLLLELGVIYTASALAHQRMIDAVDSSKGWTRRATGARIGPKLPGLTSAASAVAFAQLRTAIRTVRGRTIVLLPGPMFAILTFFFRSNSEERWTGYLATNGYLLFAVSGLFAIYALQAFSMNLFAADRSGLTMQFLAPVSDRDLAFGKLAGCAAILTATLALALAASLLVSPAGSIALWLTVIAGTYASYLLISPAAVWLSALFPLASDLTKTGSGGNPHPLPMFAGLLLTVVVSLPTAANLVGFGLWRQRPVLALALEIGWLLIAAAVAIPLVVVASKTIASRRENLGLVAQGK